MKPMPWHTREVRRKALRAGIVLGFLLAIAALSIYACSSNQAADKYAPIAASYKDQTPTATTQVRSQAADATKIREDNVQASAQNHDAKGFLNDALSRFSDFWKALPPASPRPEPIVAAESDVTQASLKVDEVAATLQQQRAHADALIASQQSTIALLVQQALSNQQLRDEAISGAEKQMQMQASLTKYEEQDKDIFGRARRAWHVFKWVCIIAIPLLIILGYLGVRYGANEITKPVASGIGAALGWAVSGVKYVAYYVGTFILASVPVVGHWVDEHVTALKQLLAHRPPPASDVGGVKR